MVLKKDINLEYDLFDDGQKSTNMQEIWNQLIHIILDVLCSFARNIEMIMCGLRSTDGTISVRTATSGS